ncbi:MULTISPECIES: LysR family transcriptional regulator [unclassified Desulfovibrio]|uniref:LysR family transcriptional regulator n=1 Tax=unclassified Desulfovibrio TaxID=2593640 RepID=UPI002FD8B67E
MNLLVVLHELLVEQSVTRAAHKLSMSQSAVSHALSKLRLMLDDDLFIQERRGIRPTAKALELRDDLEKALHHANAVLNPGDGWSAVTMKRTFRIAISDYGTYLLLSPLLARVRQEAPSVDLFFSSADHHLIASHLMSGNIHFGCCIMDSVYKDLCVSPLFQEKLVCIAGKKSRLAKQSTLSLKEYLDSPHMVVASLTNAYSDVDAALSKKGHKRRVAAVIPHFVVAAKSIENTDMILTLPYRLAAAMPELAETPLLTPPVEAGTYTYGLVWHPRSREDKGHSWLRDIFNEVAEEAARQAE